MKQQATDDDADKTNISMESVRLPVLMGSHMEFHTWWILFHVFATVWKFADAIGRSPEADLPSTVATALSTMTDECNWQKAAKK